MWPEELTDTHARLLADDFFHEISKMLRHKFVARFPDSKSEFFDPAVQCSYELSKIYDNMFEWDPAYGFMYKQACYSGYMWYLLKLTTHLNSEDACAPLRQALSKHLTITLPSLFWYPRVVETAVKDFRKVYTPNLWNKVLASPLSKEWSHYFASLLESTAYRHYYLKGEGNAVYGGSFFCDSVSAIRIRVA